MGEDGAKIAALGYSERILGRKARYVDQVATEEGRTVRIVVTEERARKGQTEPKRWHILYEIHLDPQHKPLYHVRKGYWSKPLPEPAAVAEPGPGQPPETTGRAAGAAPEEGESDVAFATRLRAEYAAPRAGVEAPGKAGAETPGPAAESGGLERQLGQPASREPEERTHVGVGQATRGPVAGEEAEQVVSGEIFEEETNPEEAGEAGAAEAEEGEKPEAQPLEEGPAGDESGPGADIILEEETPPPAAAVPVHGPARPPLQERQGPPKVSFRFASDSSVRLPEGGR